MNCSLQALTSRMNDSCIFTVTTIRIEDYILCDVPSMISQDALTRVPSVIKFASEENIFKYFKRHLLQKSIHKGKFLGLQLDNMICPLSRIINHPNDFIGKEISLVIEHQQLSYTELIQIISAKRLELQTRIVSPSITKRLAKDLAWSSDAIEGTTVEHDEDREFFDFSDTAIGQDKFEMMKHYETINRFVLPMDSKTLIDIDETFMFNIHRSLNLVNLSESDRGQYRQINVTIHGAVNPDFTKHQLVKSECMAMFAILHEMDSEEPIQLSVWLHFMLVQIHPFRDGNGRVARLLMNSILRLKGFPFACIQPGIRQVYYHALRRIRLGDDWVLLRRIVAEAILRSLDILLHYSEPNRF